MQIFVYEYVTGGGLLNAGESEAALAQLRDEGLAMLQAIATDLAQVNGSQLVGLWDRRLGLPPTVPMHLQTVATKAEHEMAFNTLAGSADATLVIAPETGGQLLVAASNVMASGGRLLGPDPTLISLATDKHALAVHLGRHDVPVPLGVALRGDEPLPERFVYPAVMKPLDGAGSQRTYMVSDARSAAQVRPKTSVRLESFHAGLPASVAFLCGPGGNLALVPCAQTMEIAEGAMQYRGGSLPLSRKLSERAIRLAERAIDTLPTARGYLGVDLVLGDAACGKDDVVLEINPRLTTSYVGLRAAYQDNLAGLMLDFVAGKPRELCISPRSIKFSGDGQVWFADEVRAAANVSSVRS